MSKFYINKYLKINLHLPKSKYRAYFDNEYLRISSSPSNTKTTIDVFVQNDLPEEENEDIASKIHVKGLFWFEFIVRDIHSDNPKIFFKRHWIDRLYIKAIAVFLQSQLIEPVMYLKLLDQEVLLMHSAGVSDGSVGFIFPAHGGTGKTTLSLRLMNRGYHLLGDDLLLVDTTTAQVSPYPRPLHVFTYNINNLEGAKVPLDIKLAVYFKNIVRKILETTLRDEFLISTRIHADELYKNLQFGQKVPIKKLVFLTKEGTHHVQALKTNKQKLAASKDIIQSADLNDSLRSQLLTSKQQQEQLYKTELSVVTHLLDHFDSITYVNTHSIPPESFYEFTEILQQ